MKITPKLLDSVLMEVFATELYSEANRLRTEEVGNAVSNSPQAAIAIVSLMKRRLPREGEVSTAVAMGVSVGIALAERLRAEEGKVPIQ